MTTPMSQFWEQLGLAFLLHRIEQNRDCLERWRQGSKKLQQSTPSQVLGLNQRSFLLSDRDRFMEEQLGFPQVCFLVE
jgi:hypothetical protein